MDYSPPHSSLHELKNKSTEKLWRIRIELKSENTITHNLYDVRAPLVAQMVKSLPAVWDTHVQSLGQEDPL